MRAQRASDGTDPGDIARVMAPAAPLRLLGAAKPRAAVAARPAPLPPPPAHPPLTHPPTHTHHYHHHHTDMHTHTHKLPAPQEQSTSPGTSTTSDTTHMHTHTRTSNQPAPAPTAVLHALQDARHRHKQGGAQLRHVLHQQLHVAPPVADVRAHAQRQLLDDPVKGVRQRQEGQDAVLVAEADARLRRVGGGWGWWGWWWEGRVGGGQGAGAAAARGGAAQI